jgi:hypothetical protein
MKKDKTYLLLPMIAYTKKVNGKKEITIGWLTKLYWFEF